MRTLILYVLLTLLAVSAFAQRGPGNPGRGPLTPEEQDYIQLLSQIGSSDIILVATVDEAKLPALPADPNIPREQMGKYFGMNEEVPIKFTINEVLKGKATIGKTTTLSTQVRPNMSFDNGTMKLLGWTPDVKAGQQQIFFLQQTPSGIVFARSGRNGSGIMAMDKLDAVTTGMEKVPMEITLTADDTLVIGKATSVTVEILNISKEAINVTAVNLRGAYLMKNMGAVTLREVQDAAAGVITLPTAEKPSTIQPGAMAVFTVQVIASEPAAWQLFGAESYMRAPIALRARVSATLPDADAKKAAAKVVTIESPAVTAVVAYPTPAEDAIAL